ncbi:MAG: ferritin family protein [SAR324 cluster bacterium]|nr:ferritin family protein [SAR324 cluster bacterium]
MYAAVDFSQLSLMDALDLAVMIEIEALERYKLFAEQLGHRYPNDAGSVFSTMCQNEEKHADQLFQRREALFGDKPVAVKRDDIFDVEAPDVGSIRWNISPFEAFQIALSSEEKALAFYEEALPYVTDPEVQTLFTELRDEEKEHVDMVNKAIAGLPPEARVGIEDQDQD